jgi:hypothetical protein
VRFYQCQPWDAHRKCQWLYGPFPTLDTALALARDRRCVPFIFAVRKGVHAQKDYISRIRVESRIPRDSVEMTQPVYIYDDTLWKFLGQRMESGAVPMPYGESTIHGHDDDEGNRERSHFFLVCGRNRYFHF